MTHGGGGPESTKDGRCFEKILHRGHAEVENLPVGTTLRQILSLPAHLFDMFSASSSTMSKVSDGLVHIESGGMGALHDLIAIAHTYPWPAGTIGESLTRGPPRLRDLGYDLDACVGATTPVVIARSPASSSASDEALGVGRAGRSEDVDHCLVPTVHFVAHEEIDDGVGAAPKSAVSEASSGADDLLSGILCSIEDNIQSLVLRDRYMYNTVSFSAELTQGSLVDVPGSEYRARPADVCLLIDAMEFARCTDVAAVLAPAWPESGTVAHIARVHLVLALASTTAFSVLDREAASGLSEALSDMPGGADAAWCAQIVENALAEMYAAGAAGRAELKRRLATLSDPDPLRDGYCYLHAVQADSRKFAALLGPAPLVLVLRTMKIPWESDARLRTIPLTGCGDLAHLMPPDPSYCGVSAYDMVRRVISVQAALRLGRAPKRKDDEQLSRMVWYGFTRDGVEDARNVHGSGVLSAGCNVVDSTLYKVGQEVLGMQTGWFHGKEPHYRVFPRYIPCRMRIGEMFVNVDDPFAQLNGLLLDFGVEAVPDVTFGQWLLEGRADGLSRALQQFGWKALRVTDYIAILLSDSVFSKRQD